MRKGLLVAQAAKATGGRKTNRRPSRPLVPEEILDEAAHLFLSKGYHHTRMQDIAAKFGVTHAALYYHFESKQRLLAAIHQRELKSLLKAADGILKQDGTPSEKLLALVRNHMRYIAEQPQLAATLFDNEAELHPSDFSRIMRLRRQYTATFTALYDESMESGELPRLDSTIAISILLGACNWIYRWYQPGGSLTPDHLVDQAMELIRGILASPQSISAPAA